MLILQRPDISQEEISSNRAKFSVEPLEPGFGLTLGNTMRRALLSRVPGVAVTGVKIQGVNHEFTSVPGVVEDVLDLLLNLKRLVIQVEDQENHTLTVKAKGPGDVTAAQIQCPAGVEVVNTDLKICTLSGDATLDMEVSIAHGVGYRLADKNKTSDSSFIPIDSIFSPIIKVSYAVTPTQVGQVTNYDKLTLDVETDGSVAPSESISSVGKTLGELWKLFADIDEGIGLELGELTVSEGSSPDLSISVDALDLSERPMNCLGRENITTVGQILEYTEDDLLNLTNFGQKSLDELVAKLDELGLSLPTSSDLDSEENADA
ncbi:DNA-directed RNA polymerase subunit alpha [Acidimicrobiia bacterium]|nr:DNA-directed RNA polymerase subunit alpha [Acidimicrobiia bacterium]MDC1071380.1 DNA-directed RNA polymerase subunit alpha [Acidimicrobiia bacterium]